MPGPTPNFFTVTADDESITVSGQTDSDGGDIVSVNVTLIQGKTSVTYTDAKAKQNEWNISFPQPEGTKIKSGKALALGTVIRRKNSKATCNCPEPPNLQWSEEVKVEKPKG
jgi:hypothetical protein